jgi:hypothetical protein
LQADPTSESEKQSFVSEDGLLKVKQKEKGKKKIVSISDLTDAFVIFMATILKRHPSQALPLTKHLSTIRTAAMRSWSWKDYDVEFRLEKSSNPNLVWDSVDGEVWLMYGQYPKAQTNLQNNTMAQS